MLEKRGETTEVPSFKIKEEQIQDYSTIKYIKKQKKARRLLNDSIVVFARYLQHEYLTNGLFFLGDKHIVYDRTTYDLLLEENPRLLLNNQIGQIDKLTERYLYLTPIQSKFIEDFLTGYTSFQIFYQTLINFLLEIEAQPSKINKIDTVDYLNEISGSISTENNIMIFNGKIMRERQQSQKKVNALDLQNRQFIYPFNLSIQDILNLLAFELPREGLITTIVDQAPNDIVSIYDYYTWISKELVRRGILIQKVGDRLSIFENTWLNYDIPPSLEPLVTQIDKTNRGLGFENITFEEGLIIQNKLIDLFYWGIEDIPPTEAEVELSLPKIIKSEFAVALVDIGIGITMKEQKNVEKKDLKGTTIEDLKHLIQKILIQQLGVTSVVFVDEQYDSGTDISKIKQKKFLFNVEVELDEAELAKITL